MNKVLFSHNSDEWTTPQKFFDELNAEFSFTVDAAATNENKKCVYAIADGRGEEIQFKEREVKNK